MNAMYSHRIFRSIGATLRLTPKELLYWRSKYHTFVEDFMYMDTAQRNTRGSACTLNCLIHFACAVSFQGLPHCLSHHRCARWSLDRCLSDYIFIGRVNYTSSPPSISPRSDVWHKCEVSTPVQHIWKYLSAGLVFASRLSGVFA